MTLLCTLIVTLATTYEARASAHTHVLEVRCVSILTGNRNPINSSISSASKLLVTLGPSPAQVLDEHPKRKPAHFRVSDRKGPDFPNQTKGSKETSDGLE